MADWRKVRLGEVCRFKYGVMPKKSDLASEGYPVYSGYRHVGFSPSYHYADPEIIVVARGVGGTGDQDDSAVLLSDESLNRNSA